MERFSVVLLAALAWTGSGPMDLAAQEGRGFIVELSAGVARGSQGLGHSGLIEPAGYLRLEDLGNAPLLEAAVLLPSPLPRVRPEVRVGYAFARDVESIWHPCDPGQACPDILIEPETRASRLEATVGAVVPLAGDRAMVRPHVAASVGVRRYRISWDGWGGPGTLVLPEGHADETDGVARLGLGLGVVSGAWEVVARAGADWSGFGPGRLDIDVPASAFPDGIDLGRRTITEYSLTVGLRRAVR